MDFRKASERIAEVQRLLAKAQKAAGPAAFTQQTGLPHAETVANPENVLLDALIEAEFELKRMLDEIEEGQ